MRDSAVYRGRVAVVPYRSPGFEGACLAAPTAGIPEIIAHEKTGFLVPADDAAGYADNLYCLLDNRSLYAQIAETAYSAVVREYGWKTYIERIWGVYKLFLQS